MLEMVPNRHPLLVHFTVALLATAGGLYIAATLAPTNAAWKRNCFTVARWNLWLGAIAVIMTVIAGFQAYATVAHDRASHEAMTDHRNWALVTGVVFVFLAVWSLVKRRDEQPAKSMAVMLVAAVALLGATGWKGGELVYRYGLGVMSMPNVGGHLRAGQSHRGHDTDVRKRSRTVRSVHKHRHHN